MHSIEIAGGCQVFCVSYVADVPVLSMDIEENATFFS